MLVQEPTTEPRTLPTEPKTLLPGQVAALNLRSEDVFARLSEAQRRTDASDAGATLDAVRCAVGSCGAVRCCIKCGWCVFGVVCFFLWGGRPFP